MGLWYDALVELLKVETHTPSYFSNIICLFIVRGNQALVIRLAFTCHSYQSIPNNIVDMAFKL